MIFDDTWWLDDTWSRLMLLDVTWCNPFFVGNHPPNCWGIPAVSLWAVSETVGRKNCANAKDRGDEMRSTIGNAHIDISSLVSYNSLHMIGPTNQHYLSIPLSKLRRLKSKHPTKSHHLWSKKKRKSKPNFPTFHWKGGEINRWFFPPVSALGPLRDMFHLIQPALQRQKKGGFREVFQNFFLQNGCQKSSGWWFQPIWKILGKMGIFPK